MCGITGIAATGLLAPSTPGLVAGMCDTLVHRGPDQCGVGVYDYAVIGVRRLAVIDPTHVTLPVTNEDGTVAVALNGEIYNFQSLRRELSQRGHQFRTRTDTEVIAHLYEELGVRCVERLEGMFAIAIWDERQRELVLLRDRLGVKPLFYRQDAKQLSFGSEIKAILYDPVVERSVNWQAVDRMLTFGFTAAPDTFYNGICELPAASVLRYRQGASRVDRYWDCLPVETAVGSQVSLPDAVREGTLRIRESVAKRLVSDVPVGAFLSGGVDSSITVALMAQLLDQPVQTFSIGFRDEAFSELPYARLVARQFGTDHHEFIVEPAVQQILPDLIRHHDGPFYDTSAIPTYHLCRIAREHVTVALAGDGGDELFAGYNIFAANRVASWVACLPGVVRRRLLPGLAERIPESSGYINRGRVAREFLRGVEMDPISRYARWASKTKREVREQLYQCQELRSCLSTADADHLRAWYDRASASTPLSRLLYTAIRGELTGDMLVKVDRMSMASSLEVRSPLMDHTLFEWSFTLADRMKLRGTQGKYLLRRIALQLLPSAIVNRPKRGFAVPLDRWLRTGLMPWVKEILLDDQTRRRGLCHSAVVERMIRDHLDGPIGYGRELWTLLTLELWLRICVDQTAHCADVGNMTHVGPPTGNPLPFVRSVK